MGSKENVLEIKISGFSAASSDTLYPGQNALTRGDIVIIPHQKQKSQ